MVANSTGTNAHHMRCAKPWKAKDGFKESIDMQWERFADPSAVSEDKRRLTY